MFSEYLTESVSPTTDPIESKRLSDTLQTISQRWVPAHPMLRKRFRNICLRPNPDRQEVLAMLMQDPGLCIFVLRSIRRAFPGRDSICLRTALNEIELEQLADMAEAPEYEMAGVSYKNASRHQTFELQQSVFMSSAASLMAERASLDATHAAWAAFIKEEGVSVKLKATEESSQDDGGGTRSARKRKQDEQAAYFLLKLEWVNWAENSTH